MPNYEIAGPRNVFVELFVYKDHEYTFYWTPYAGEYAVNIFSFNPHNKFMR